MCMPMSLWLSSLHCIYRACLKSSIFYDCSKCCTLNKLYAFVKLLHLNMALDYYSSRNATIRPLVEWKLKDVCMPVYVWDGLSLCRCRGEQQLCVFLGSVPQNKLPPSFWHLSAERKRRRRDVRSIVDSSDSVTESAGLRTHCSAKVEFCPIWSTPHSFYFSLLFGSSCVLKSVQQKRIICLLVRNKNNFPAAIML